LALAYSSKIACLKLVTALFGACCGEGGPRLDANGAKTGGKRHVTDDEVLDEFRAAEALLEGHFILSSGLRSPRYLQCARVLMSPARAARLAQAVAAKIPAELRSQISAVVSPAMGGVIAGQEVARALDVDAMFVERPTGTFELRRGFRLSPGQKVLMMEDVVTTGLSSREAMKAIAEAGGEVIAAASLVDRSNGTADLGVPFFPLIRLDVPSYEAESLPPELAAIPAVKPGSRAAA
jgi:orotate phosphoribosyltransferase